MGPECSQSRFPLLVGLLLLSYPPWSKKPYITIMIAVKSPAMAITRVEAFRMVMLVVT